MWLRNQKRAWDQETMRTEIQNDFVKYGRVFPRHRPLNEIWGKPDFSDPLIAIHFAEQHVATIDKWSLDEASETAILDHFRVHDIARPYKMGEPLLRGFAKALKSTYKVHTIYIRETHQHVPGYVPLFIRLGATQTQIVNKNQEWEWTI